MLVEVETPAANGPCLLMLAVPCRPLPDLGDRLTEKSKAAREGLLQLLKQNVCKNKLQRGSQYCDEGTSSTLPHYMPELFKVTSLDSFDFGSHTTLHWLYQ